MGMTDEQWKEVEKKLVPPFGRVELEIDGYKVAIVAQLVEKMKFSLVVYVNGFIRAEWSMNDCEIRRRFYGFYHIRVYDSDFRFNTAA